MDRDDQSTREASRSNGGESPRQQTRAQRQRRRFKVSLSGYPASFTVNVSVGGFCTELMRVLRPGTPVEGNLLTENGEVPFTGVVAWVKLGDARLGQRGRMGVQFKSVSPELARVLGHGQ